MTKTAWLVTAVYHRDVLRDFIACYHPAAPLFFQLNRNLTITAPKAEALCEKIREEIRRNNLKDPVESFNKALEKDNVKELLNLLNSAWFGVPESRDCWGIRGFKEAVDLMEDPPEEEIN